MITPLLRQLAQTKRASRSLVSLPEQTINAVLRDLSRLLIRESASILRANAKDCVRMKTSDPRYDRLLLTDERLRGMASDIKTVASLPSPLKRVLEEKKMPNGLRIKKVTVPLGVIGIIYEARPNVTADTFTLCFKAGNACVLKGGSDAKESNAAIVRLIQAVLRKHGVDPHAILLLPPHRKAVETMLKADDMIDVIIPRGSRSLIEFVRKTSSIPVIETGAGIVHTYVDASGDTTKAAAIVFNAKTRRPSVCNALDTLIIHRSKLSDLPTIVQPLLAKNVEVFADKSAYQALKSSYDPKLLRHATAKHFGTEFLSLRLSIKTVNDIDEALDHIARFSSRHSEAIVAEDSTIIRRFFSEVDAAAVYANASTAFTDGAQFGMGAEIGISTQKLHARGPMGLRELTSYKWIVEGKGEVRT